jgi:hypothetical protein
MVPNCLRHEGRPSPPTRWAHRAWGAARLYGRAAPHALCVLRPLPTECPSKVLNTPTTHLQYRREHHLPCSLFLPNSTNKNTYLYKYILTPPHKHTLLPQFIQSTATHPLKIHTPTIFISTQFTFLPSFPYLPLHPNHFQLFPKKYH